jgi:hypothetical protein
MQALMPSLMPVKMLTRMPSRSTVEKRPSICGVKWAGLPVLVPFEKHTRNRAEERPEFPIPYLVRNPDEMLISIPAAVLTRMA